MESARCGTELVVVGVPETKEGVLQVREVGVAQALGAELSPELDNVLNKKSLND